MHAPNTNNGNANSTETAVVHSADSPPTNGNINSDYNNNDNNDSTEGGIQAVLAENVVDAIGVSVIASEEEERQLERKRLRRLLLSVAIFLSFLVVAIVTPLVTKNKDNPKVVIVNGPPTIAPTGTPTSTPSSSPTTNALQDTIDCLRENNISAPASFITHASPQFHAASWITNQDTFFKSSTTCTDKKFRQRYAMATFYYAVNGDDWAICNRQRAVCTSGQGDRSWLSSADECSWYKVKCESTNDDSSNDQYITSINFGDTTQAQRAFTNMNGTFPVEMVQLSHIQVLILPGMDLKGSIVDNFRTWSDLQVLTLNDNLLQGPIPSTMSNDNPQLVDFNIIGNSFTNSIPPSLGNMMLTSLQLGMNFLTGTIPSTFANLQNLTILDVSENKLSGSVPDFLFTMSSSQALFLNNNTDLTGTIPTNIGNYMTNLRRLRLGSTQMTGTIPTSIFTLPNMIEFDLSNAKFSGTLSEQFALWNNSVEDVILSNNDFSGRIPKAFDVLEYLESLELNGNKLTGSISQTLCKSRGSKLWQLQTLYVGCDIACNCCNDTNC